MKRTKHCCTAVLPSAIMLSFFFLSTLAFAQNEKRVLFLLPKDVKERPTWERMLRELKLSLGLDSTVRRVETEDYKITGSQKKIVFDNTGAAQDMLYRIFGPLDKEGMNEAFYLRTESDSTGITLSIYGLNERALIYGGYYVAEQARLDAKRIWGIDEFRKPVFPLRIVSDSDENALRLGYNAVVLDENPSLVALFGEAKPPIIPPDSDGYRRTMANREKLAASLALAKHAFLEAGSVGDEFVFPKEVLTSAYRDKVIDPCFKESELENRFGSGRIFCFAKPELWDLYRMKYREALSDFPQLDFVMLRFGEHRSTSDYVGNAIFALNGGRYCEACRNISYIDRLVKTIEETYNVVVKEKHKRYIQRTWDLKTDAFNNNPAILSAVLQRLPEKKNLIFSTKYTFSDFWRYSDFNPLFQIADVPHLVEIQCTREYEGKGAFPNFLGQEYKGVFEYLRGKNVVGAWSWNHGGGSDGPVLKNDLWNQANIYAVSHLLWNPDAKPNEIAERFARLYFGEKAARNMAKMLLLSEDAILKWRYFKPYSEQHRQWDPGTIWTRDDKIAGDRELFKVYRESKKNLDQLVREKDEALDIVKQMQKIVESEEKNVSAVEKVYLPWLSEESDPQKRVVSGKDIYQFVADSLKYEHELFRFTKHYLATYFYAQRFRETRKESDSERAREELVQWKKAWDAYNRDMPKLAYAPSLYKDDGMLATIDRVQYLLRNPVILNLDWWAIGPFDNEDKKGFDTAYPPEKELNLTGTYTGIDNQELQWKRVDESRLLDDYVDLSNFTSPSDWTTLYATTAFTCPQQQRAVLHIGSDDAIKVWLNGKLVIQENVYRAAKRSQNTVEVELQKGENRVLIKLMEGILGCGFYFEFRTPDNRALDNLQPVRDGVLQGRIRE
jgi:hypothetical protein